jgi:hypothetical protein
MGSILQVSVDIQQLAHIEKLRAECYAGALKELDQAQAALNRVLPSGIFAQISPLANKVRATERVVKMFSSSGNVLRALISISLETATAQEVRERLDDPAVGKLRGRPSDVSQIAAARGHTDFPVPKPQTTIGPRPVVKKIPLAAKPEKE